MKKLLRKPQLLFALAACAAIVAGCGGGGNTPSVVPQSQNNTNSGSKPQSSVHRILFYSVDYLKTHPELAPAGAHQHGIHAMASGTGNLIYNGGPVQHSPKVYLVFWGWSSASDTTHDPDGMANYLVNYVNALGGSNLGNVQTQYYDNSGNITNPHPEYAGVWYDSSSLPPSTYADSDIQGEASRAASHFGYNADANYFVVTPHNYTTSGFGTQWCAYHGSASGSSGPIAYTDFPYVPDVGSSCGMGSVTSPGTLDGASIVGGHEMIETITDPGAGNGWVDSSGEEIGDKCAWTNLQNVQMYGGSSFPNQPEYSNAVSNCAYSYGSVATPTPSPVPTATPTPVPTSTPASGCSGQLLVNPGFESGQTGWTSTSGVVNTDGAYSHTGVGYAWLDGYGTTHTDTLSQSASIKAGCGATLTYYLWITTQETTTTTAYDKLTLTINGVAKQTFSNLNHTSGYVQKSLDLSSYAGQTVTIKWTGTEDASLATNFWIDDTALTLH